MRCKKGENREDEDGIQFIVFKSKNTESAISSKVSRTRYLDKS
jgi:hypothetical protein